MGSSGHDQELVPTEAGRGVGVAEAGPEVGAEGLEQLIACGMSEGVVDRLEAVEVDEHQGIAGHEGRQERVGVAPVADAGQLVDARRLGELVDEVQVLDGDTDLHPEQPSQIKGVGRIVDGDRVGEHRTRRRISRREREHEHRRAVAGWHECGLVALDGLCDQSRDVARGVVGRRGTIGHRDQSIVAIAEHDGRAVDLEDLPSRTGDLAGSCLDAAGPAESAQHVFEPGEALGPPPVEEACFVGAIVEETHEFGQKGRRRHCDQGQRQPETLGLPPVGEQQRQQQDRAEGQGHAGIRDEAHVRHHERREHGQSDGGAGGAGDVGPEDGKHEGPEHDQRGKESEAGPNPIPGNEPVGHGASKQDQAEDREQARWRDGASETVQHDQQAGRAEERRGRGRPSPTPQSLRHHLSLSATVPNHAVPLPSVNATLPYVKSTTYKGIHPVSPDLSWVRRRPRLVSRRGFRVGCQRPDMGGVVERTDDPVVSRHHEMSDGTVSSAVEDERVDSGGEGNERANGSSVAESRDDLVGVRRRDSPDRGDGAVGQLIVRLGPRHPAPLAVCPHGKDGRMALGRHLAKASAFAFTKVDLP